MKAATCFLILCAFPRLMFAQSGYVDQFNMAMQFQKEGKSELFLKHILKANHLRVNHQILMHRLAWAYDENDRVDSAAFWLKKTLAIDNTLSTSDTLFKNLASSKDYKDILEWKSHLNRCVGSIEIVQTINDPELHIEDMIWDETENRFFVGSINKKMIYEINDNSIIPVVKNSLFGGVTGMIKDQNYLFVCVVGCAEAGVSEDSSDFMRSEVMKIDISTGEIIQKWKPSTNQKHFFGDLFQYKGDIYVSDSIENMIYLIKGESMIPLAKSDKWLSLQGLTVLNGQLFVADYITGLHKIDIQTGEVFPLANQTEYSLKGIDGLYTYGNSLIAIQNGVTPNRIIRIQIEDEKVVKIDFLANNQTIFGEPTLGEIHGKEFYFVPNSFWPLNRNGNIENPDSLHPKIARMTLFDD